MKFLGHITRHFFWKPAGFMPSLESLETAADVAVKSNVTLAASGLKGQHPLTVAELPGGKIVGNLRLVATAQDVVVGGLQSLYGCADPQNHYLFKRRRFRMAKYRRGTALLLGASNSDNYYHWLLDSLPRWKMLQAAGWANYDFVLLHDRPLGFQDEVLDRLQVPMAKRLRCSKNFVHQFERLVVPAMPFPPEEIPPWVCAWLRSLFPGEGSGPQKVYLRRGGGRRRLLNEAELEAVLTAQGFVAAQPAQLLVAEQAKLLSSARCIVAPHGAALTNVVFAPPGALFIDLFHPEHTNSALANLAKACGHTYKSLAGQVSNKAGDKQLEYTIDVPTVLKMISGKN